MWLMNIDFAASEVGAFTPRIRSGLALMGVGS